MTIGDRIRKARTEAGLSKSGLARQSGLNRSTISRVENGQIRMPGSASLIALARALGTSTDHLLDSECPLGRLTCPKCGEVLELGAEIRGENESEGEFDPADLKSPCTKCPEYDKCPELCPPRRRRLKNQEGWAVGPRFAGTDGPSR